MRRRELLAVGLLSKAWGAGEALTPVDEAALAKLLAAQKGKVVLLDFWATWCSPCLEELPLLVKLEAKLKGRGFVLLAISCDEADEEARVVATLRKAGVKAPYYLKRARNDEAFIDFVDKKWRGALPALFLYDRQGRLRQSLIGETPLGEIEAAIGKLL